MIEKENIKFTFADFKIKKNIFAKHKSTRRIFLNQKFITESTTMRSGL